MELFTTQEVADLHGVTRSRIVKIAAARKIEAAGTLRIGTGRPAKLWTPEQAAALEPGATGRPAKKKDRTVDDSAMSLPPPQPAPAPLHSPNNVVR